MTLVVAITGEKSIWMLTDRRLSSSVGRPKDDARKMLFLETTDGLAMLGYAGLGSTAARTEPSDWMMRVLRGSNLPLEQALGVLADAARAKLPRHLESLAGSGAPAHHILIPAFLNGEARLYSIDLVRPRGHSAYLFRYTRHVGRERLRGSSPRVAIGGSGAIHLLNDRHWARDLLRAVSAHDAGRISSQTVARAFAQLNDRVARAVPTVGHRCVVAWRLQAGGGAHEFFAGRQQDVESASLPSISRGLDINAIAQVTILFTLPILEALRRGEPREIDKQAVDAELAKLPDGPDDVLA